MPLDYRRQLDDWHIKLATVSEVLAFFVKHVELDDDHASVLVLLRDRLEDLVESCPFPPFGQPAGGHSCVQAGVVAEEFQP